MYWIKERVSLDATYRNNYNNANILIYICSHILSVCCNLGLINIMHYGVFASLKIYFFECWCWSNTFVEKCNSFNSMKLLFIYTKGLFFVLRAVIAMLWFSLQRLGFSSFCEYVEICGINCSWSDQSIFFNSVNC